jgi:hypothetical protein
MDLNMLVFFFGASKIFIKKYILPQYKKISTLLLTLLKICSIIYLKKEKKALSNLTE